MKHTFTKQQVLNISTGLLHTKMDDVYKFFNDVIEPGIFTHMLPNAADAIRPIILSKLPDIEQSGYHPDAEGVIEFEFNENDKILFWESYSKLPSLLSK